MPREDGLPPGTLLLLILRILSVEPLHGYAIAQRIALLSSGALSVEEGSLYPALQKVIVNGWAKSTPAVSGSGRTVRLYRLTASGRKQLASEEEKYQRMTNAIAAILRTA